MRAGERRAALAGGPAVLALRVERRGLDGRSRQRAGRHLPRHGRLRQVRGRLQRPPLQRARKTVDRLGLANEGEAWVDEVLLGKLVGFRERQRATVARLAQRLVTPVMDRSRGRRRAVDERRYRRALRSLSRSSSAARATIQRLPRDVGGRRQWHKVRRQRRSDELRLARRRGGLGVAQAAALRTVGVIRIALGSVSQSPLFPGTVGAVPYSLCAWSRPSTSRCPCPSPSWAGAEGGGVVRGLVSDRGILWRLEMRRMMMASQQRDGSLLLFWCGWDDCHSDRGGLRGGAKGGGIDDRRSGRKNRDKREKSETVGHAKRRGRRSAGDQR